jgi:hypothetical protein
MRIISIIFTLLITIQLSFTQVEPDIKVVRLNDKTILLNLNTANMEAHNVIALNASAGIVVN